MRVLRINYVSVLALVSIVSSFSLVAARPHNKRKVCLNKNFGVAGFDAVDVPSDTPSASLAATLLADFDLGPQISPTHTHTHHHHHGEGSSSPAVAPTESPKGEVSATQNVVSSATSATSSSSLTSSAGSPSYSQAVPAPGSSTVESPPPASTPSSSSSFYPPQRYSLVKNYMDDGNFFDQFDFYTGSDPTNGFVHFVNQQTAQSKGLVAMKNGVAYIAPESSTVSPGGRQSVRLQSTDTFTEVLVIADFAHLPEAACGSWPAFWTTNLNNWPVGGEIDIIEGVNTVAINHVALHTTTGCTVQSNGQRSTFDTQNCYVDAAGQASNAGCGGFSAESFSYGYGFNDVGGGVYAMDWRPEGIRVWVFPRGSIPQDIQEGCPTTKDWGLPDFDFSGPGANIQEHFNAHSIIFDQTFCGDWAGSVFSTSDGCSGSCSAFVANNPSAFAEAYFAVNNLTVWKAL